MFTIDAVSPVFPHPALVLTDLERIYERIGERIAGISIPSLTFFPGKVYAIVGPNGSGKTTLLRALSGHSAYSGTISFQGEATARRHLRRNAILLSQFPESNIFPTLSIRENLSLAAHRSIGLRLHRLPTVSYLLRKHPYLSKSVSFLASPERNAGALSGGQIQLLSLYMAFLSERKILLLDEFLANLDPRNRRTLASALKKLVLDRSALALYVSHNLREALTWCDELIVLGDGRVQFHASCSSGAFPTPDALEQQFF